MRFSELVGINIDADDDWFDAVPSQDTPLYIDPYLVFNDAEPLWAGSYEELVEFFVGAAELVLQSDGTVGSPAWDKAIRLLTFPEPKEFALGFSLASPDGAGTGPRVAKSIAEVLALVGKDGAKHLSAIAGFTLFCDGIGPDGISDILCNVLKHRFIEYTSAVADKHGVPTQRVKVRHSNWDKATKCWKDEYIDLPVVDGRAVILTPARFLKDLPEVSPEGFWGWAEQEELSVLRAELNFDLASSMSRSERIAAARRLAFKRPNIAFKYLDGMGDRIGPAYNTVDDPSGRVSWLEDGRLLATRFAEEQGVFAQPAEGGFEQWVLSLAESFKHVIEETDGWKLLWDAGFERKRDEKIAQALAGIMWRVECKTANVDISKEVDMGRGPVDFKFSQGWQRRAHLEVKYIGSSKFYSGAEKQLPQYLRTENISYGVYLAVGFADSDFEAERLNRVRATCKAMALNGNVRIDPVFVDARPRKPSASKL